MSHSVSSTRRPPRAVRPRNRTILAAAAVAALAAVPGSAPAATWNGGTGNWNNAANWTGGIPDTAGETAVIDGGKPGASAVTLDINPSIASFTIDAGDALTIGGNITLTTSAGGTVNGTLTLASNGNFSVLRLTAGAQTLSGSGQVLFGGIANNNQIDGTGATLTVAPGLAIRTGAQGGAIRPTGVINQGTFSAQTAGMTFTVDPTTLVNQGAMQASAGTLNIAATSWTNTGTINVSGGVLQIGGTVTTAGLNLAGFVRTGGTIEITGTLNNTGAVLALTANTGAFDLRNGGTLRGGTVTASGGAAFAVPANATGTADGVNFDTDVTVNGNSTLTVANGISVAAGRTLTLSSNGNFSVLRFNAGAQTIGGAGQVVLAGIAANNQIDGTGATITIAPGVTVRTGAQGGAVRPTGVVSQGTLSAQTAGMTLTVDPTTLVNQGTLRASAGTLAINATSWTNTGTIDVSGTGILQLGGTIKTAGLNLPGFVRTGGTIEVTGTLDNSGTVLALAANTGSFNLRGGGTLRGGTVTTSGGAQLLVALNTTATLDGVTLDTDLDVGGNSTVALANGLNVLAGRTVTLASNGNFSVLRLTATPQTIGGAGQIVFGGIADNNQIDGTNAALTIGPGVTIRTGAQGGAVRPTALINQGTLSAETAGETLTVDPTTFVNQGTVRVSAGTMAINATAWTNTGSINVSGGVLQIGGTVTTAGLNLPGFVRTGGTIDVTGTITNTGTTLALAANTGSFNLRGGTLRGGTVTASGGAAFALPANTTGTAEGVNFDTDVTVNGNSTLNVANGISVAAGRTLTLASNGNFSVLRFNAGAHTLGGAGQIVFAGIANNNQIDGTGATITIAPGVTIRTGAQGGAVRPTGVVNQGTLSAQTAGMTFTLDPTTFVNQGTVQASAGTFAINATTWTNTATLNVSGTGLLELGGTVKTAGLNLPGFVRTGGTIDVTGTVDNAGAVLALAANTGSFNIRGGTLRGGTVTTSGGAQLMVPNNATATLDGVTLDTDFAVGGNATVNVANSLAVRPGRTVTLSSNGNFSVLRFPGAQTLGGGGQVAFAGIANNNQIDGSGPLTLAADMTVRTGGRGGNLAATTLVNNGLVSAQDPGQAINITSTNFTNQGTLRAQAGGTILVDNGIGPMGPGTVIAGPSGTVRASFIRQSSASLFGIPGTPATYGRISIRPKAQGGQTSVLNSLTFQLDAANKPVGTFDLADNALIVDYTGGSPMASLRGAIANAYANGTWTGAGITYASVPVTASRGIGYAEAAEALGPAGGPFQGQTADGSSVVMRYTLYGDTNLNGVVDFNDLVNMAQNYNTAVFGTSDSWWFRGDFTYDGVVDFNDLVKFAQNYNTALPGSATPGAPVGFGNDLAAAFAAVPEPAGVGLLAGAALATSTRRRRTRA